MKSYRMYIALAAFLIAITSVTVAPIVIAHDKPSWIDSDHWIELGDNIGIVITTQPSLNRERILEEMRLNLETDSTGSVTIWGPEGIPDQSVYGYMMVKRDGSWFRFQAEPGSPRTMLIR